MSITLENVTKRYAGGQVVVDRVSLNSRKVRLFAFRRKRIEVSTTPRKAFEPRGWLALFM